MHALVERFEREGKIENKEVSKFIENEIIQTFNEVIGGLKKILRECTWLGCK
ncbi:MAG: hypothetical protein ACK4FM_02455 [Caldimicrobium sp.]